MQMLLLTWPNATTRPPGPNPNALRERTGVAAGGRIVVIDPSSIDALNCGAMVVWLTRRC